MKTKYFLYLFVLLTIIYVGLVVSLPPDPAALERYKLTTTSARLLSLAVIVPYILVWLTALYGFVRVRSYALLVKDSPEGKSFGYMAAGLTVLAFSLPVTGIISSTMGYFAQQNPDFMPTATITRNYLNLAFSMVTFILLFRAAEGFLLTFKSRSDKLLALPKFCVPLLIVLSSMFTWFIAARPTNLEANSSSYFLPNWLLIFTIAIPYLFVWYMGSIVSYRLFVYMHKVKGRIYKQAFNELAKGTAVIVAASIFIQFVTTLSARVSRLKLTPILLLIYLLVILYGVGFGFVARGAQKLKKIEEV